MQADKQTQFPIGGPWWVLVGHPVHKIFNMNTKFLLWSPNFCSHPYNVSESMPLCLTPPKRFCVTWLDHFLHNIHRDKNRCCLLRFQCHNKVFFLGWMFYRQYPRDGFIRYTQFSVAHLSGNTPLPISHSRIKRMASRNLPFNIIFEKVQWRWSWVWVPCWFPTDSSAALWGYCTNSS